jgi:hypothetical protein
MTSLTVDLDPKLSKLDPKVLNVGRLIGLLTQHDRINKDWFAHADTEIGNIPRRVRELLQLTANVLEPGTAAQILIESRYKREKIDATSNLLSSLSYFEMNV